MLLLRHETGNEQKQMCKKHFTYFLSLYNEMQR